MARINTPSNMELGILAGLSDSWRCPFDDYFERSDYDQWKRGFELGRKLLALLAVPQEVEATR